MALGSGSCRTKEATKPIAHKQRSKHEANQTEPPHQPTQVNSITTNRTHMERHWCTFGLFLRRMRHDCAAALVATAPLDDLALFLLARGILFVALASPLIDGPTARCDPPLHPRRRAPPPLDRGDHCELASACTAPAHAPLVDTGTVGGDGETRAHEDGSEGSFVRRWAGSAAAAAAAVRLRACACGPSAAVGAAAVAAEPGR